MKMGARPRAQTNSAASGAQERASRGDAGKRNKKRRAFFSRGRMDAPGRMSGALMAPLWGALRPLTNLVNGLNFFKSPQKPKGKGTPHVEYNYINTTRKKTRR